MVKKLEQLKVKDLMSSPVISIQFSEKVSKAIDKMEENDISCLPVLKGEKLKGIIFYREIVEKGIDPDQKVFNLISRPRKVLESQKIKRVAEKMATTGLKALPVVKNGKVVGIISRHDLCREISKSEKLEDEKIKSVMSEPVLSVGKDDSLLKARSLMLENKIRRLPVIEKGKIRGIITLTDIAEEIYKAKKIEKEKRVEEVASKSVSKLMTSPVITVSPEDSVPLAAKKTVEEDISGLPVTRNGKVVGIVTQLDLVKELVKG